MHVDSWHIDDIDGGRRAIHVYIDGPAFLWYIDPCPGDKVFLDGNDFLVLSGGLTYLYESYVFDLFMLFSLCVVYNSSIFGPGTNKDGMQTMVGRLLDHPKYVSVDADEQKEARRPRARQSTTGACETPLSNLSKHVPTGDPHRLGLGTWRATASVPRAITKADARTSFLGVFAGHAAKAVAIQPPRHLRRGDFRFPPIHLGASRCLSSLLPNLELMRLDDEARPCQSHALLSPLQGSKEAIVQVRWEAVWRHRVRAHRCGG